MPGWTKDTGLLKMEFRITMWPWQSKKDKFQQISTREECSLGSLGERVKISEEFSSFFRHIFYFEGWFKFIIACDRLIHVHVGLQLNWLESEFQNSKHSKNSENNVLGILFSWLTRIILQSSLS